MVKIKINKIERKILKIIYINNLQGKKSVSNIQRYLDIEKKEPVEIFYAKANKPYEKRLITPSRIYVRDGALKFIIKGGTT